MNRSELLDYHRSLCAEAQALMERKNHDYTGSDGGDPFGNFTAVESAGLCSTQIGMMVRLLDKFRRLKSFFDSGELKVTDESLRDTIIDGVNYLVLIGAYVKHLEGEDANDR